MSNEQRRKLLWELFQQLIASDDDFFGTERERTAQICYDCGMHMYSVRKFMDRDQERTFTVKMVGLPG